MDQNNFGARLREALGENGLTQLAFARLIDCSEAAVSKYLNEGRLPRLDVVSRMAAVLHTTTDFLLGQEENKEFDYRGVKCILARNAASMTIQQKKELIDALLGED